MFIAGCVTNSANSYLAWELESTPKIFDKDTWVVVIVDLDNKITDRLTLRFTDEPMNACAPWDWKSAEVIAHESDNSFPKPVEPAYYVKGARLFIDLSAPLCDAHMELDGYLSELGWVGEYSSSSPWGGEVLGSFVAVPQASK